MTRLLTVAKQLILNPIQGVSEKEAYFNLHFLNARNEVNEIERLLDIELNRSHETSEAGRKYTRYQIKDEEQIRKLAEFYNMKLNIRQQKFKDNLEQQPITEQQIQMAIKRLK